ncbi:MAG: DUF4834 family protein [Bacteroidales bacterium]
MGAFVSFILFILFIFIVLPIIRILIAVFSATHKIKKQYNQQSQTGANSDTRGGGYYRGNSQQQHQQRRKQFSQSDGEYVDFEEIPTEESIPVDHSKQNSSKRTKEESQISDAQFEEID